MEYRRREVLGASAAGLAAAVAGCLGASGTDGEGSIAGGNIAYADGTSKTRTITTAITLETRRGEFETALVLGAVLLGLVLFVNGIVMRLGGR